MGFLLQFLSVSDFQYLSSGLTTKFPVVFIILIFTQNSLLGVKSCREERIRLPNGSSITLLVLKMVSLESYKFQWTDSVNNSLEPIEAGNSINTLAITRFSKRNRLSAVNWFVC
jgi:hypothetical protein